jgi:hypothetical protein
MERTELASCINRMKRIFERLAVTDETVELWYKLIGRHYTKSEFDGAFEQYLASEDRTPSIASIKKILESRHGHRIAASGEGPKVNIKPTKIDICLDVLGVQEVNRRLATLIDGPATTRTVLSLVGQRGWAPKYRALLDEMYQDALLVKRHFNSEGQGEIL